jgi:tripeptidyl-peptidase-1
MCGVYKPTNVMSISYGEQEQDLPAYYQKRQCNEWLKLGMQGVSIFVASGDTGVGGKLRIRVGITSYSNPHFD